MNKLWSMSTSVRESARVKGFLKVAKKMEGKKWDNESQADFQIMLVQYHEYLNDPSNGQTFKKLNQEQCEWLTKYDTIIPYDIAKSIILAKNYTGGPDMRGRNSMSPLVKLGLVYYDDDNRIVISDLGNKYINDEIDDEEFFVDSLVKLQYPNPIDEEFDDRNIKPFIAILHIIKRVNELCESIGLKSKGISRDEFGIFCLSILNYNQIEDFAKKILEYRTNIEKLSSYEEKKNYKSDFIKNFLVNYKKPEENVKEYTDNMIRYLRQTKLIYIRGKYENQYIDLEPRRKIEIDSLLSKDDGHPLFFSDKKKWLEYYSFYGTYDLPYETIDKLSRILEEINKDNIAVAEKNGIKYIPIESIADKTILKKSILKAREERTKLQNIDLKRTYFDASKIDETIDMLFAIKNHQNNKMTYKPSIEFEKWANIALNIINDSILIKPNTKVGDDNEPINTAPGGVADIECYYNDFNMICEVTTLTSRDQWYNEGQPVMRHLRDFETANQNKKSYCLFLAPTIHNDTLNTFWISTKYEYEGQKQNIAPLTIMQFNKILSGVKSIHLLNKKTKSNMLMQLLNDITDVKHFSNANDWKLSFDGIIDSWVKNIQTQN